MITKFAGSFIFNSGKILLVQEAHEEARGLWSLPLGKVEGGESEKEAAEREMQEETGVVASLNKHEVFQISGKDFKSLSEFNFGVIELHIFDGQAVGGHLEKGSDVLDAKWFSLEKIKNLPLRGKWIFDIINKFI